MREQLDLEPGPDPTARMREQTLAFKKAIGGSAFTKIAEMPGSVMIADLERVHKMLRRASHATSANSEQMRKTFAGIGLTSAHSEQTRKAFAGLDLASAFGVQMLYVQKHLAPIRAAGEGFQRIWHEARVPNWPVDFGIKGIIDLMRETGYCLVWSPRPEIIEELLQAAPADRRDVLRLRRKEILDDLTAVTVDVGEPSMQLARHSAEEALAAFRAGNHRAAQALAAVIFTHVIHANFGHTTSKALEMFKETEPEEAVLRDFRLRAIFMLARRALSSWRPLEEPVPGDFNRHASLHRLTAEQYTEHNALVGLMLVIPLVREVDARLKVARAKKEQRELASATS